MRGLPCCCAAALLAGEAARAAEPAPGQARYPTAAITETRDWLVDPIGTPTALTQLDGRTVALGNGLISRVFTLEPDWATWDVATTRGSALRGVSPEATVTLDGIRYNVGGLLPLKDDGRTVCPQPFGLSKVPDNCPTAYFNRSTPLGRNASAFSYVAHTTAPTSAPFPWRPARHAPPVDWPPRGLQLIVNFSCPNAAHAPHRAITISVHYELHDGAPVMTKRLSVHNHAPATVGAQADARVPPDQQGPVNLQPCHIKLPASDWESHWRVASPARAGTRGAQRLQLSGAMASRNLCMQVVKPTAIHGKTQGLLPEQRRSDGLEARRGASRWQ